MDRYKEISFTQLRAFCECVRQGSFAGAARSLQLSQPAVWQQVRALERLAGVLLLERRGRTLQLTEEGRLLWEQAHTVLGNVDSLWTTFHERRQALPRTLTLIATPALLAEELIEPVVKFHRAYPDVTLRLQSQHGQPVLDWLTRGDADLAVVPADMLLIADPAVFHREQLGRRIATLITAKDHPLARRRRMTLHALTEYPLILPLEDNAWFVQVREVLEQHRFSEKLRCQLRVGHILSALNLVRSGLAPALMPMPQHAEPPKGLLYRSLDHMLPDLPIYL
ncbi:MAG: LysR family transcriptional regulator, partial [Gemmatales bacterium]|nr:LysR family transcriptional regulator [Gemmatales bacterium]MDW8386720.1 LysR family transcriptional regulator [Gemmatales bacterium]